MYYIVYTVDHQHYLFNDKTRARKFKSDHADDMMTWYIAETPVNNQGPMTPAQNIDRPVFPV